jgi:hypothetical protein
VIRRPRARLGSAQATHSTDAGNFVRWARRQKLTSLDFAATGWGGPTGVINTGTRWEQARWLLHDNTLKPEDRVAGLLVLLYAQWPAAISRLTLGHVQASGGQVRIRLAERLRHLGIRSGQARSAALFQLATDPPATVLARMLGIHIAVAVAWQRASACPRSRWLRGAGCGDRGAAGEHLQEVAVRRRECPISYSNEYGGYWVVSTYDAIADVLRRRQAERPTSAIGRCSPLFTPATARQLEPSMRVLADQLIDKFMDCGECEVASEFARLLPGTVLSADDGLAGRGCRPLLVLGPGLHALLPRRRASPCGCRWPKSGIGIWPPRVLEQRHRDQGRPHAGGRGADKEGGRECWVTLTPRFGPEPF